jgi:hypothetical protein
LPETGQVTDVRLIVIRGNSGSGKSAVSASLRQAYGRGVAVVSQDLIRRDILRERDYSDAVNIGLIDQVARYSLAHGYHVVLDGILAASRYEQMLAGLKRAHGGPSYFYTSTSAWTKRCGGTRRVRCALKSPHRNCGTGTGRGTCSLTSASGSSQRPVRWSKPSPRSSPRPGC